MELFQIFTLLLAMHFTSGQNHGSTCGGANPACLTQNHLICQQPFNITELPGTCVCKVGTEYDGSICRALEGEACQSAAPGPLCTDNANCNNNICVCAQNFLPTVTGSKHCRATYDRPCSNTVRECNEEARLYCLPQTPPQPQPTICRCADDVSGGYTEWIAARSKCVSRIGSICNGSPVKRDDEECVPNGVCRSDQCQCVTGYTPTKDGKQCSLKFGEPCSAGGPACNSDEGLSCNGATCGCNDATHALHSPGVCLKKARETCEASNECLSGNCATIGTTRECLCNSVTQIQLDDKTCGTIGEYCYLHKDCDGSRFEICDSNFNGTPNPRYGKCACTEGVDENGKCVNKAGSVCTKYQNCVNYAECIEGKCECMDGYLRSSDDYCRPSIGRPCGDSNPCEAGLNCDGICSCPIGQEWLQTEGQPDSWKGHCVAYVGGNCTTATPYCTKNAVCTDAGVCECKTGFSHTYYDGISNLDPAERRCLRTYNETCGETDPCNPGDFLTCSAGKCECLYGSQQVYDPASKKCKGLSGAFCGRIIEENTGRNASCVPNAECVPDIQGIYKCKCFGSNVAAGKDCTEGTDSGASSLVIISVFTLVGFSKLVSSMFN